VRPAIVASIGVPDMIREGLCDILASDYYYPAMLLGLARLKGDGIASLHALGRSSPAIRLALWGSPIAAQ
jgi:alpha-D-ribose 1-methylphosphonate 5-triphosphate diphosphatase PhnM